MDLVNEIIPHVIPSIINGLMDYNDDIRAVAAETLHPIAAAVVNHPFGISALPQILSTLWGKILPPNLFI